MRTLIVLMVGLLLSGSALSAPAQKRDPGVDEYVACVIGHAMVEMEYGNVANADTVGFDTCEPLSKDFSDDEHEGAYHSVQALLAKLNANLT